MVVVVMVVGLRLRPVDVAAALKVLAKERLYRYTRADRQSTLLKFRQYLSAVHFSDAFFL